MLINVPLKKVLIHALSTEEVCPRKALFSFLGKSNKKHFRKMEKNCIIVALQLAREL